MEHQEIIAMVQFSKLGMDTLIKKHITNGTFSSVKKTPINIKEEFGTVTQKYHLTKLEFKKFCRDVRVFRKKTGLDITILSVLRKDCQN